jgi:uncharacterized repeat protein (TIGR01451 family)
VDNDVDIVVNRIARALAASNNSSGSQAATPVDLAAFDNDMSLLLSKGLTPSQIDAMVEEAMARGMDGSTPHAPDQLATSPGMHSTLTAETRQMAEATQPPAPTSKATRAPMGLPVRTWLLLAGAALLLMLLSGGISYYLTDLATGDLRSSNQQYQIALNKIPSDMALQIAPLTVQAGTQNTATISITVKSLLDEPIPDGTEINVQVLPAEAGTIVSPVVTTTAGQASAIFKPGTISGTVQIMAQTKFGIQKSAELNLGPPPQAKLSAEIAVKSDSAYNPGSEITFTFAIKNSGDAPASSIKLVSAIPAHTTFLRAGDAAAAPTDANQFVTWEIAQLPPGETKEYSLVVRINPDVSPGTPITSGESYIEYAEGNRVPDVSPANVNVQAVPTPIPTEPPLLPTNTVEPPPPPITNTSEPAITVTPTVSITATATGALTPTITVTATTTVTTTATFTSSRTTRPAHLFSEAIADNAEEYIVIFQLPANTPVELLEPSPTDLDFSKVALTLTVSSNLIDLKSSQILGEGKVAVGDDPNAPPNTTSDERRFLPNAKGYPVTILDTSQQDQVLIRIEGWMLTNLIEQQ